MRSRALLAFALIPIVTLAAQVPARRPVRLVVAIAIDQFRPDYLDRFKAQFNGGLGMLLRDAVFFRHGEQDHAITETAPGHSTMMSGRSPASTGIVTNDLGVPDSAMPLIGSPALGASPRRFLGTTLLDWMSARDPKTRSLSVSRKDRGAILPIGRLPTAVYWWSRGHFTTSRYYADTLPAWVVAWNAREPVNTLRGTWWTLSRPDSFYPEPDDRPYEHGGKDFLFPHQIIADSVKALTAIVDYPVMDSLTLDFAWRGVRALQLGRRNGVDFLSLSLSTTDAVGHAYGRGSREMHDQVLDVDRWLGAFFDSLKTIVPLDQVIISLTADHGSTEFPTAGKGGKANLAPMVHALNATARALGVTDLRAIGDQGLIYGNFKALTNRGLNVDSLADATAAEVSKFAGVKRVYTHKTLAAALKSDIDAMRWRRELPGDFPWLVATIAKPDFIFAATDTWTGHGTTNADDVQVPILFRVPGVPARRIERTVRTVDIAPTLAALLGIKPAQKLEGIALPEVLAQHDAAMVHARALLASRPIIDGHNDLAWEIRVNNISRMDVDKYPLRTRAPGQTDFTRLKSGGVGGQFWSVYIPGDDTAKQYGYAKMQLEQIDIARRFIASYPDQLQLALGFNDVLKARKAGKVASLLGMEGGHAIENSLALLRMYYDLGVRYMTLTHNVTLDWADAALDDTKPSRHGLTDFGRDVVRGMNRLGMIVDLSHVAPSTMSAALDVTVAPVMFSHSSARALMDHPRNVPDSILARLPKNGGVVMVTFVSGFLKDIKSPAPNATPNDVADHIEHVRKVAGIDHVGLGSDYDGTTELPDGMGDVSGFPLVFAELIRRGWSDADLRKLAGGNILRVLRDVETTRDRLARARQHRR